MSSASDPSPAALGGRLHPAAMAVWPLQQAVGLVIAAVFGGGPDIAGGVILLVGGVLVIATSAIRWRRFTWSLEGGTLVLEQGLLQRSRRVIPADRVQSVDLVRPLRHRVLGVVQVRVEAIGGRDSEGLLEALSPGTALAVQHALIGARAAGRDEGPDQPGPAVPPPGAVAGGDPVPGPLQEPSPTGAPYTPSAPRLLARVSPGALVVAGLTGGRVGVVAVLLGAIQQVAGDRFDEAARLVPTDIGVLAILALVAVGVVVVFGISVAATVVTYWGFEVSRDDEELRISRGLLEQRLETVPIRRIQSVRIEQNLLRKAVGMASVKADLAGRAGGGDAGTGLLLPIAPVAEAERLAADLLGTAEPVHTALAPAPLRSRRRYAVRGLLLGVVAGVATIPPVLLGGAPTWLPAALGVAVAALAVPLLLAEWRALGRAEVAGVLVGRTGALVRRRVHVPIGRVQQVSMRASPFQRRLGLADVTIGIARSGGWAGPRLLEVDAEHARALIAATATAAVAASRRHR